MSPGEARVALLTNFVPPYRVPMLRALEARVGALRVLVSTAMEPNRDWRPDAGGLDVEVQRSLSLPRLRRPSGFRERLPVHVPLDTAARLRAFDPDVLVSSELGMRSLEAVRFARRNGRPVVLWATLSERTERGRGWLRSVLRRHLLKRADAVVVNGESGARYIAGLGYPPARIHRVRQASPVAWSGHRKTRAGPLELLFVGQAVERKGLEPLVAGLESWCAERDTELRLTTVGRGFREGVEERGRLRVTHRGPVPFDELPGHYQAADVLVFPTLADEWGLVVNEGMASALPVLGSVHSQAVTELVEDGGTGWRYDPEEPGALAAALDRMAAAGREGIRAMGGTARRHVAGLTPEFAGERLAGVVAAVLDEGGGSRAPGAPWERRKRRLDG